MIQCTQDKLEIKGSKPKLLTEATLILSNLIRKGVISDVKDLLILFETVGRELRNEFEEVEEGE